MQDLWALQCVARLGAALPLCLARSVALPRPHTLIRRAHATSPTITAVTRPSRPSRRRVTRRRTHRLVALPHRRVRSPTVGSEAAGRGEGRARQPPPTLTGRFPPAAGDTGHVAARRATLHCRARAAGPSCVDALTVEPTREIIGKDLGARPGTAFTRQREAWLFVHKPARDGCVLRMPRAQQRSGH